MLPAVLAAVSWVKNFWVDAGASLGWGFARLRDVWDALRGKR